MKGRESLYLAASDHPNEQEENITRAVFMIFACTETLIKVCVIDLSLFDQMKIYGIFKPRSGN